MNMEPVRHLTQEQLAERWQVSEASLERWRSEGRGPVHLKVGGRVRYRLTDIEAFERAACRRSTGESAG
jgi:predicted site-specific integrase-resolvase